MTLPTVDKNRVERDKGYFKSGGDVEEEEYNSDNDLFAQYDTLPDDVKAVLDKYSKIEAEEGFDYEILKRFVAELEPLGYTFDYYLDAEPYNLRKTMANGGGVGEVYTDDDGIKYQVGQKAGGVWTIFSSSDNWTERDEFESGFANEQDAILVAKEMAGLTPEFADGGSITKVYNFPDFGVKSFKNLIDEGVFVSKHRTKRNAMEYNRIKFNRMDYAQQAEYDKKLNKEKITYDLQLSDVNGGGTYQVSKQVYDYANIPETEEKSYYIKYERGGDVSDLVFSTRKLVKSKETKVKHNLINGEIDMNKLKSIIGYEPEYPTQFVGSIKLTKCFMRPYYKI